ncbi:MAG: shikimate dehydrogenase [Carboxylicivirga sp.]|jgi:shikimate dehydrogenase|nr:shikimate dehydrogenase [Carboxylicivirga sp.]
MRTFGLIGYPLAQSFSQKYFTEKFSKEDIDARFLNFEIEHITELPEVLKQHAYISGFSVTIPHKENVFEYLDELDHSAKAVGACNAVKVNWDKKQPKLIGYNTDLIGFSNSIKPLLKESHKKALILGTGGAAKAVAEAFRLMQIEFKYVSRNKSDNKLTYKNLNKDIIDEFTILVNCTPLGMFPNIDTCPDMPYDLLSEDHILYDLTYNPETTLFMQKGINQGAVVKNGLEMLHLQAEAAWSIWNS